MRRYKTLIDIGLRKMSGHIPMLLLSAVLGALYGHGMMRQEWAAEFGLAGMIVVLVGTMLGTTIFLYLFVLVPIRTLFGLRTLKHEFGPATVRDLWAHYSVNPYEPFDVINASIQNGDYFRDYKACKQKK